MSGSESCKTRSVGVPVMNTGNSVIEVAQVDETPVERSKIQNLIPDLEPHGRIEIHSDYAIAGNDERWRDCLSHLDLRPEVDRERRSILRAVHYHARAARKIRISGPNIGEQRRSLCSFVIVVFIISFEIVDLELERIVSSGRTILGG